MGDLIFRDAKLEPFSKSGNGGNWGAHSGQRMVPTRVHVAGFIARERWRNVDFQHRKSDGIRGDDLDVWVHRAKRIVTESGSREFVDLDRQMTRLGPVESGHADRTGGTVLKRTVVFEMALQSSEDDHGIVQPNHAS